jgi:hypothetical protein
MRMVGTAIGEYPEWRPSPLALSITRQTDPAGTGPTSIVLEHLMSPFLVPVNPIDETAIFSGAYSYLRQVASFQPGLLPEHWIDALNPSRPSTPSPFFGWLPIRRGDQTGDPMVSFFVERRSGDTLIDTTLVLLASERLAGKFIASEFGLRVAAQLRKISSDLYEMRVAGLSASVPFGIYSSAGVDTVAWSESEQRQFLESLVQLRTPIASALGLNPESVRLRGLRLGQVNAREWQVELRGIGSAKPHNRTEAVEAPTDVMVTPYEFLATGTTDGRTFPLLLKGLRKFPVVGDARRRSGMAHVFLQDAASHGSRDSVRKRRTTRTEAELDPCRAPEQIFAGASGPLTERGRFRVVRTPFVRSDIPIGGDKRVRLPGDGPRIRSNTMSAVSAYWAMKDLFKRFDAYSIDPDAYFKIAQLPIEVMYRSGVRPGPGKDGQTINARVLPKGWGVDQFAITDPNERPKLQLHLALANLSHRWRTPWDGKHPSPAEPFGIAADSRWIWHEIAHILLMASVGELEFRFAHSAGDALAAIVADPQSQLATDPALRGATFPWVFLPRRHDRCVLNGWSWCGTQHQAVNLVPDVDRLRRKGYRSEQILSSSLFRLYRSLGGSTFSDQTMRNSASHYSIYLIMSAIGRLGPIGAVPAQDVDHFVQVLREADTHTETWKVPRLRGVRRIGGCAHKVIRWAFEAQGLYGDPAKITDGPGFPPAVDIYIADRRDTKATEPGDVPYGPGSYKPVPLDWCDTPAWHATEEALDVRNGQFFVELGNRGDQSADAVTVRVFWHKWLADEPLPVWNAGAGWEEALNPDAPQTVPPNGTARFGPFEPQKALPRCYILLAIADCAGDPANTNRLACNLPCSRLPTPLVDLVSGDNNLGLRVIGP